MFDRTFFGLSVANLLVSACVSSHFIMVTLGYEFGKISISIPVWVFLVFFLNILVFNLNFNINLLSFIKNCWYFLFGFPYICVNLGETEIFILLNHLSKNSNVIFCSSLWYFRSVLQFCSWNLCTFIVYSYRTNLNLCCYCR
jgi:hypothetical protein